MNAVVAITGFAVPLLRANIDTDQIMPGAYFAYGLDGRHGEALFGNWRYRADGQPDPDFALNQPRWRGANILLAGRNFGCGSSRESAAKALRAFGFDAIIAPSFSNIFFGNALHNALAPLVLPDAAIVDLAARAERLGMAGSMRIDIARRTITPGDGPAITFDLPDVARDLLLAGGDEVALILRHAAAIDAFRARDRRERPWIADPRLIPASETCP